jgi:predicted dehydrogenase
VAVIGAGPFGRFTIESYRATSDFQVLAVADQDESALRAVPLSGVDLTTDWHRILADERIEVVHVATPPFVRGAVVDSMLAAGKSVFCEKPLALTVAEADEMIHGAEQAGVGLGVDYVMRYQPAYRFLAELAASRSVGSARSISFQNFAQAVPPGHWFWDRSASGGILVEHGVHFFDAYGLVAGPVDRVAGRQPRAGAVDVTVWYRSGAIGRYYHEFGFLRDVEYASGVVLFEGGHVMIEGWIPTRVVGTLQISPDIVAEIARSCDFAPEIVKDGDVTHFRACFPDRSGQYRSAVVAGMRDLVHRHRHPHHRLVVTAYDARASLAIALAGQQACDAGRIVIVGKDG